MHKLVTKSQKEKPKKNKKWNLKQRCRNFSTESWLNLLQMLVHYIKNSLSFKVTVNLCSRTHKLQGCWFGILKCCQNGFLLFLKPKSNLITKVIIWLEFQQQIRNKENSNIHLWILTCQWLTWQTKMSFVSNKKLFDEPEAVIEKNNIE